MEAGGVDGVRNLGGGWQVEVDGSTEASGSEVGDSGEVSGGEVDDSIPSLHNEHFKKLTKDQAGGYCLYIFYSNSTSDCITPTMQAPTPAFIHYSFFLIHEANNNNHYLQCVFFITLLRQLQNCCLNNDKHLLLS